MVLLVGTYFGTQFKLLGTSSNFRTFFLFFTEGRMHDARMLAVSGLYDDLKNLHCNVFMVTQPTCLESTSKLLSELGF